MKKAVQFGAGNIGRGFLGQLLFESGYETVFVDVDEPLTSEINRRGSYPLRLVDSSGGVIDMTIANVRAVDGRDIDAVGAELGNADIAGTSVGVKALPHIAPGIVKGMSLRAASGAGPLNILLCENQWHAASVLRGYMAPLVDRLTGDFMRGNLGLVETVIGRMVPVPTPDIKAEDPLLVVAEPYKHLPVARAHFVGEIPQIVGVEASDRFEAYEARKLFIHNAGHAALAYLGYRKYEYIWQCALDEAIRDACTAALAESERALTSAYGFDPVALRAFSEDLMVRFENRALADPVSRVAGDPLRKLRPDDRLIGAANLCIRHGIPPLALATVINAALKYDEPADPSAVELQHRLSLQGRKRFLADFCHIEPGSTLAQILGEESDQ
jgi:mannitol-1-phosphate 5-dehydrogenase